MEKKSFSSKESDTKILQSMHFESALIPIESMYRMNPEGVMELIPLSSNFWAINSRM